MYLIYKTNRFLNQQIIWIITSLLLLIHPLTAQERSAPLIIDHTCVDISQIPSHWIETVRNQYKIHYGHTSHGEQITTGLLRIENQYGSLYNVSIDWNLPASPNSLCILDRSDTDVNLYFSSVQQFLNDNPSINISIFGWCGEAGYSNWQTILNDYLSQMQALEEANPNVTFIYMTGHAQENDCPGCNRSRFNEQLRQYVIEHNKVLFDFADLDAWYNGEQQTYVVPSWCACAGDTVPIQHPHYNGSDAGHTTFESCENKAKAFWWMLVKLAGWEDITPVELEYLSAVYENNAVTITWKTQTEMNNFGFNIYRSNNKFDNFVKINANLIKGKGTTYINHEYHFQDINVKPKRVYFYKLQQIDFNGSHTFSHPVRVYVDVTLPGKTNLIQNYPNPFNPSTNIVIELPKRELTTLEIFDLKGEKILRLFHGVKNPGRYNILWNGKDKSGKNLPSGIYLCRLKTESEIQTKRLILCK